MRVQSASAASSAMASKRCHRHDRCTGRCGADLVADLHRAHGGRKLQTRTLPRRRTGAAYAQSRAPARSIANSIDDEVLKFL